MSGRINDINVVLPLKTGVSFLAKDKFVNELLEGQIGIFDSATNKSVDATSTNLSKIKEFSVVLGVGKPVGGNIPNIRKSPGWGIQTRNVKSYTYQSYSEARSKILKIDPGTGAYCEKDFMIKIELSNGEIYRTQGFNAFSKIFSVTTSCCDECYTCYSGDTNEVTSLMVSAINADDDGIFTAKAIIKQDVLIADVAAGGVLSQDYTAGDEITDFNDLLVLAQFNKTVNAVADKYFSYITVEASSLSLAKFLGINLNYFLTRQTDIKVTQTKGFSCDKDITVIQELAYEMGSGYDLYQQEYHAQGHQEVGPYRVSPIVGLAKNDIVSLVDDTEKYDVVHLSYANSYFSESREYDPMGQRTTVAFPVADTTARNTFISTLDGILASVDFDPLTDDVAATTDGPTGVESLPTSTSTDGLSA